MEAPRTLSPNKIGKIMVRGTNWIGDAVMTTPALGDLRAAFPHAEIVMVANPLVSQLFNPHPYCDRVIVYDKRGPHRGPIGLLKFARALQNEGFEAAFLLQNAIEAAFMARFAGIPIRAGYKTDGRGLLLTHGISVGRKERGIHHTEYYRTMLAALGIGGGNGALRLHVTETEKAWAHDLLGNGDWMGINPGAAYGSAKRWYPERFARVADTLVEKYGVRVVMTGGPKEAAIGEAIVKAMTHPVLNLVGRTTVRRMAAVLARCTLLVSNDSGPMHVAAALGCPIVALFGPTDHTVTSPKSPLFQIVRHPMECAPCLKRNCPKDHGCMKAVTPEDVLEAIETVLQKSSFSPASAK